ncbi:MAG: metallophosphoesterase [Firmicutes bacterium]|nr:metallophosphoesterase [Bacillota bacterium]
MIKTSNKKGIFKQLLCVLIALAICLPLVLSPVGAIAASDDVAKRPEQIAVSVTSTPQTSMYVTFTTVNLSMTSAYVLVNEKGETETTRFDATRTQTAVTNSFITGVTSKLYWRTTLTGLTPNTEYEYLCVSADGGGEYEGVKHRFTTAIEKGDKEEFSFIFVGDPQINSTGAGKAWSTVTQFIQDNVPDARFLYIAGDLTDVAADEGQWEGFFNQPGMSAQRNNNYENMVGSIALAPAQGNHDSGAAIAYNGHISTPDIFAGQGSANRSVYSFDYGMLKMIVLCNNGGTVPSTMQLNFLREEVAAAKAAGQWTAVCWHGNPYTGASHLEGLAGLRRTMSPLLAELDVDFTMAGHDHVFARGQVDAQGNKAASHVELAPRHFAGEKIDNVPLYVTAPTASTLKFYSTGSYVPQNNPLLSGYDPCAPDYGFLDITSARNPGHEQNPYGPRTSTAFHPSYTVVTVNNEEVRFDTYMFPYNATTDVAGEVYLFDSYTYSRCAFEEAEETAVQFGDEFMYKGKTADTIDAGAFDMDATTGWTQAQTAIGFGNPEIGSGLKLSAVIPAGNGANQRGEELYTATYFKKEFTMPEDFTARFASGLSGTHRIGGGGMIMYLNGMEVYRFNMNNLASTDENCQIGYNVDWDLYNGKRTIATDRKFEVLSDYSAQNSGYASTNPELGGLTEAGSRVNLIGALRSGANVLTCVVFQRAATNNTLWFDLDMQIHYRMSVPPPAPLSALDMSEIGQQRFSVQKTSVAPVIDGTVDAAYGEPIAVLNVGDDGYYAVKSEPTLSDEAYAAMLPSDFKLYVTYDDNYLYVAATVVDQSHNTPKDGTAIWEGDYLGVDIGTRMTGNFAHMVDRTRLALGVSNGATNNGNVCMYSALKPTYVTAAYTGGTQQGTSYVFGGASGLGTAIRNEETKVTSYEMRYPWTYISPTGQPVAEAFMMFYLGIGHQGHTSTLSGYGGYLGAIRYAASVPAEMQPKVGGTAVVYHIAEFN